MSFLSSGRRSARSVYACLLVSALLAACGGGSNSNNAAAPAPAPAPVPGNGGSGTPSAQISTPTPVPDIAVSEIATESPPVGPVVDIARLNLLPLAVGDHWEYSVTDANGASLGGAQRQVASLPADSLSTGVQLTETERGESSVTFVNKQDNGIFVDYTLDSWLPPQAARQIGQVREYAVPAYAAGETRTVVRQGVWDQDIDGDGKLEQFRLEYTQVFRGFEQTSLPWGSASVVHFSNSYRFVVTTSKGDTRGVVSSEEAYLAPGIGPVKFVRHAENLQGTAIDGGALRTWTIQTATVGGKNYTAGIQ